MMSELVEYLRAFADIIDRSKGVASLTMIGGELFTEAADEIERLRADNASLMRLVGEEGRANRMTMLFESQQVVLDAIAALHQERDLYDGDLYCVSCDQEWPCATYLLIPPEATDE